MALHRRVGAGLLERDSSAVSAAHQLARSARPGDTVVLDVLDRATAEALATAPSVAPELALRALELTEPGDRRGSARGMTAVRALRTSRRLGDAITLARSLLEGTGIAPDAAAELRIDLAWTLLMAGSVDEAVVEAETVTAQPGLADHRYDAADTAGLAGLLAGGDAGRARSSAEAILAGERNRGDDAALAGALTTLAMIAWDEGHVADALSLMRGAVGRVEPAPADERRALARLALGSMLCAVGDLEGGSAMIDAGSFDTAPSDRAPWSILAMLFRARLLLARGHLDEAEVETRRALTASELQDTRFLVPLIRSLAATTWLLRDDVARARAELALAPDGPRAGRLAWIEARVVEAGCTDRGRVLELLEPVYADIASHRVLLLEEPASAAWLVRAAKADGDLGRATAVVVAAEQLATGNRRHDCVSAIALHARGVLERDADALEQAAALHWQPWAQASATEDAAAALAQLGRTEEARSRFSAALAAYRVAGSRRDEQRVRNRLDRIRDRARRRRPVQGWESLTDGELRVVALVAEGLTNRQAADRAFLSRHTVDFHLRQAFRKLGINSRVELVRLAFEQDGTRPRETTGHREPVGNR